MRVKRVYNKLFISIGHHVALRFFTMFTPIILGVLVGIQWLTTAFLIIGLHPRSRSLSELTDVGKYWFRPEYDIGLYIIGCGFILVLVFFLSHILRQRVRREAKQPTRATLAGLILVGFTSFVVYGAFILLFKNQVLDYWKQTIPYEVKVVVTVLWLIMLMTPGVVTMLVAVAQAGYPVKLITAPLRWIHRGLLVVTKWLDVMIPLLIVAIVYVPNWRNLAGKIFLNDQFLHWDGFTVRAALALRHGIVLGRDIFIQYGIGWPLLLSSLNLHVPLSYGRIIEASIIYACIYYIGVYLLLRLLTKDVLWSVSGISIILYFHLFLKNFSEPFFWGTPSSTLLRSPFDVWFFIALFLTGTAKTKFWHYVMAIITGLALLFGFDTGMYLLVTLLVYFGYSIFSVSTKAPYRVKDELQTTTISLSLFLVVVMSGFFLVGRSAFFTAEFWWGLLEGVREYGSGVSNLPLGILKQNAALILFEVVVAVYLTGIANLLMKLVRRQDTFDDLFAFALSLYGLATLLIFVSRSHVLNILHPTIPFWILIFWTAAKIHKSVFVYIRDKWLGDTHQNTAFQFFIPAVIFVACITILITSPQQQQYPHVFNYYRNGKTNGFCLLKTPQDICGLSATSQAEIDKFTAVISWMQQIKLERREVAVFDDRDTLLYLATENAPWFRYRPGEVFTKKQLKEIHEQILNQRPHYVLMEENTQIKNNVWEETRILLTQYYYLKNILSGYGVWVLK